MEFIVVPIVALLTSGLTLFSGFGLGTLLLPAFLLFFSPELAVAMTAIVHFLNNVFKLALLGRRANWGIVIRFGVPAIAASFAGAALLFVISAEQPLASYTLGAKFYVITPVKLMMGLLIGAFALMESLPSYQHMHFHPRYLPLGGVLSGFFGGVSGHQGALRSAFLIRAGLSKEEFIATGVVIACLIDVTRLGVYARHLAAGDVQENAGVLVAAILSACIGAFVGNRLVAKVTMRTVQTVVVVLLTLIAFLLVAGFV